MYVIERNGCTTECNHIDIMLIDLGEKSPIVSFAISGLNEIIWCSNVIIPQQRKSDAIKSLEYGSFI